MSVPWFARKAPDERTGYRVVHWKGWAAMAAVGVPMSYCFVSALRSPSIESAIHFFVLIVAMLVLGGAIIWLRS